MEIAADAGIDAADGLQYVLGIPEDVSGYTFLPPSRACTANGTVDELVRWCAVFEPPTTWVSDNATHFLNHMVRKLAKALGVEHRFSVANSERTNGIVERIVSDVIHGAIAMLNERGRPLSEWVVVQPAVQWALHTAWRKRLQATPYHVMMGREPRTAFDAPIDGDDEGFQFSPIDEKSLQKVVISLVDTEEEVLTGVLQGIDADRPDHRARGSRGKTLPHFTVGDYVLMAWVSRQGKHRKLMSTWTGLWRVANDDKSMCTQFST